MDSQGLFNHETSQENNSKMFAIGTLISSIQVFNIATQFQKDQLQYLQFVADFARYPKDDFKETDFKCFQSLMLLVRDWVSSIRLKCLSIIYGIFIHNKSNFFFFLLAAPRRL